MKLQAAAPAGYTFTAYGDAFVAINRERYEQASTPSLLVRPEVIDLNWQVSGFDELTAEHFAALAALKCDVLLFGTGRKQRFPSPALLRPLIEAGIGIEVMDTPAACRTYNLLMTEGRAVAAALIIE